MKEAISTRTKAIPVSQILTTALLIFIIAFEIFIPIAYKKASKVVQPYIDSSIAVTTSMDPYAIKAELENMRLFTEENFDNDPRYMKEINEAIEKADYLITLQENGSDRLITETNAFHKSINQLSFVETSPIELNAKVEFNSMVLRLANSFLAYIIWAIILIFGIFIILDSI